MHHQERRRGGAAVAAGVVAALAVLLGASWLVLQGWQPSWPVRVATPTSATGDAATEPGTRRVGDGVAVTESTMTREAGVAAAVSEPQDPPPPAAEVEGQPRPTPSPREETASQPARQLPRATEATLSRGERSEPESTTQRLSALAGSGGHEVTVHIEAAPLADGFTGYTVRLHERDGRPVTHATVSIRGRQADGALVEATLDREAEPGLYRAVVRVIITEARLRIASVGRVQEVPLPDAPG
jgi:hypothetical protein